jgi:hypothetical protein
LDREKQAGGQDPQLNRLDVRFEKATAVAFFNGAARWLKLG